MIDRIDSLNREIKKLEREAKEKVTKVLSQFTRCGADAFPLTRDEALMLVDALEEEGIKNVFPIVRLDGHWMVMRMKKTGDALNPGAYERLYFRGNR